MALTVYPAHLRRGVVATDGRGEFVEPGQLVLGKHDGIRARILLKARNAFRSRNGYDVVALGQQPRQGDLGGRGTDVAQLVRTAEVVPEVLREEPGVGLAVIAVGQLLRRPDRTGQEAAAQRRVCDEPDSQFTQQR